jgi:hypothetical protein
MRCCLQHFFPANRIRSQARIRRADICWAIVAAVGTVVVELYDSSRSLADTGSPIAVARHGHNP